MAILLVIHYRLWVSEDGVQQTRALRIAIHAQREENAELEERNRALEAEVADLKNGLMAIEERARSEMGMIRADETFYRILDQPLPKLPPPPPPRTQPPGKPVPSARPSSPTASQPAPPAAPASRR